MILKSLNQRDERISRSNKHEKKKFFHSAKARRRGEENYKQFVHRDRDERSEEKK